MKFIYLIAEKTILYGTKNTLLALWRRGLWATTRVVKPRSRRLGSNPAHLREIELRIPRKRSLISETSAMVNPPTSPGPSVDKGKTKLVFETVYGDPKDFAGPKRAPTAVYVRGQYTVFNRPRKFEVTYGVQHP